MVVEVQVPSGAQIKTKTMDRDKIYKKILELVPSLDLFLKKNNVLEEYKICLYNYNIYVYKQYGQLHNEELINHNKKFAITYSFDWTNGNEHLILNNMNPVDWRLLHYDFIDNYKSYSIYKSDKLKII